ncbi:hypothetical protein MD484_g6960, partial [Candolleomyces efflorescens]
MLSGDSYSSVTLQPNFNDHYHPDSTNPLGVEFPGYTYNEPNQPNWVGHLITKYCPGPKFDPLTTTQGASYIESPLLVYDYARGGDQVMGVQRQIQTLFLPNVGKRPQWASWGTNDTLFVTWVGINDCAFSHENAPRIELLFSLQGELYASGARNFLLIDLPPMDRSPAYRNAPVSAAERKEDGDKFLKWNYLLKHNMELFSEKYPDSTLLLFSAYRTFSALLDDPDSYGLPPGQENLRASIQGRFISFILKRSLGHLFKPGQLNSPQIDSQIGSGYVQINDLELDEPAINGYLQGTPLVLETGTVQSVTARIPWPNPLTSTIGASAKSLHLKFRVAKIPRGSRKAEADLAESVLSVAESFVHDELTDQEEAGLWESIHSSTQHESEDNAVPGGLDPFISHEEELQADPTGISLFATLIERLLARFEFDAQDIQVSLTDPDNITLRFSLAELQYSTTSQPGASLEGIRRTLVLKGIDVFTTNHFRPSIPSSPSTTRPSSPIREGSPSSEDGSPQSSNSSLDEETEMRMSQSIAVFPPRPVSPSESASGSIYHSIMEQSRSFTSPQREAVPQSPIVTIDAAERRFISFGSAPISIHLTTPSPGDVAVDGAANPPKENIQLSLQSGALAIALLPWQIVGLSRLAEKLTSIPSSTPRQSEQSHSSPQSYAFEASINLKGICILLLPSSQSTGDVGDKLDDYFAHAFTPPALSVGYTRILVDTITGRATVSSGDMSSQLDVTDVSIFQYFGKSSDAEGSGSRLHAIPVLITDPCLPTQYDKPHNYPSRGDPPDSSHLQPTLRTVDRRNPTSATFGSKLSHWRTRSQQTTPSKAPSIDGQNPCLSFAFHRSSTKRPRNQIKTEQRVQVDVAPLSIFVDLEMTLLSGGIFSFVNTLLLEQSSYERFFDAASDSPQALAQDASDTDDESPLHDPARIAPSSQATPRTNGGQINLSAALKLAMIRVSVLAPSPPGQQARSGPLIVDLHGIDIYNKGIRQPQDQVRFDPAVSHHQQPQASGKVVAQVQCRRIVLGCSTPMGESSMAILSIGSLTDGGVQQGPSLLPVISVLLPDADDNHLEDPKITVNIDIPSIYASVSKDQWDSLQYWIDDLSQAVERFGTASKELSDSRDSKNASMIGSRYFARSQRSSTYDSNKTLEVGIKLLASVNVTERMESYQFFSMRPAFTRSKQYISGVTSLGKIWKAAKLVHLTSWDPT